MVRKIELLHDLLFAFAIGIAVVAFLQTLNPLHARGFTTYEGALPLIRREHYYPCMWADGRIFLFKENTPLAREITRETYCRLKMSEITTTGGIEYFLPANLIAVILGAEIVFLFQQWTRISHSSQIRTEGIQGKTKSPEWLASEVMLSSKAETLSRSLIDWWFGFSASSSRLWRDLRNEYD